MGHVGGSSHSSEVFGRGLPTHFLWSTHLVSSKHGVDSLAFECDTRLVACFSASADFCAVRPRGQVAAKVAEADLLRRLQESTAGEADLRHMLRRRDIRIEELKREQAASDRLTRSSSGCRGPPWSVLAGSRLSAGCSSGGGAAAVRPGGRKVRSPAERAATEVAQAAAVLRLELELAEAAARGDVGDAGTRAAERLACRLLPEDGRGSGGEEGACLLCGRPLRWEVEPEASRGRGASFLMPSVEVERKAAAAALAMDERAGEADTAERGASRARLTPSNARIPPADSDYTEADCSRDETSDRGPSADGPRTGGHGETPPVVSRGLSRGVQQLEAQLARLEAVSSCRFEGSGDDVEERLRSASPRERSRLVGVAWAEVVRELRVQVAALRDRAEATEQLLNVSSVCREGVKWCGYKPLCGLKWSVCLDPQVCPRHTASEPASATVRVFSIAKVV